MTFCAGLLENGSAAGFSRSPLGGGLGGRQSLAAGRRDHCGGAGKQSKEKAR